MWSDSGARRAANRWDLAAIGGDTMRNYGAPGAKSRVFDPLFATQHELIYGLNFLCRHGVIANAYESREKCSAMAPSISATSTSPRKSLEIVNWAETTKNGCSTSCAMRSQNDKCCRVVRVAGVFRRDREFGRTLAKTGLGCGGKRGVVAARIPAAFRGRI